MNVREGCCADTRVIIRRGPRVQWYLRILASLDRWLQLIAKWPVRSYCLSMNDEPEDMPDEFVIADGDPEMEAHMEEHKDPTRGVRRCCSGWLLRIPRRMTSFFVRFRRTPRLGETAGRPLSR